MVSLLVLSFLQSPAATASHDLDFWVGNWDVYVGKDLAGTDNVTVSQRGFSVHEYWKSSEGSTGESLFYYLPAQRRWKQVWVTEAGVYKEKLSEPLKNGVRFTGTVYLPNSRTVQDRTTLTKLPKGEVRQLIEWTKDGKTWTVSFDAVYRPVRGH